MITITTLVGVDLCILKKQNTAFMLDIYIGKYSRKNEVCC